MAFENADGSFFNETGSPPVDVVSPLTGVTVVVARSTRFLFVKPAGPLAALTLGLPKMNPNSGHFLEVAFNAAVTALTVNDGNGVAVPGAPTAGAVGAAFRLVYVPQTGWVKWR